MELKLKNGPITFEKITLDMKQQNLSDKFWSNKNTLRYYLDKVIDKDDKKKSNHTLKQYAPELKKRHSKYLDYKLGDFLKELQKTGHSDLKGGKGKFLNDYGDKVFCKFRINEFLNDKGIYCYIHGNKIMYIGRCVNSFKKRFNADYGNISPYNCLKDGQPTDCHINSLVNSIYDSRKTYIGIYTMTNKTKDEIIEKEKLILSQHKFEWNIQTA